MYRYFNEYRIIDGGKRKALTKTINTADLIHLIKYADDKFCKKYNSALAKAPLMLAFNAVMLIIEGLGTGKSKQQIKELIDK